MENGVVVDKEQELSAPDDVFARVDLAVNLGDVALANPIMPASGCFGPELAPLLPLEQLGAVVTKTVFAEQRAGNPAHRLTETAFGMLNSVGIPSPGSEGFRNGLLRKYQASGTNVVVSIGGLFMQEYYTIAEGSWAGKTLQLSKSTFPVLISSTGDLRSVRRRSGSLKL
ncbi:hypothetical protein [Arthrobacter sp. NA-172]|uniref:hypothetical protein n=1 Tax=Arthrobacter sp. NA-172 TaxID=3367524 RepID=UPI003754DF8C